MDWFDFYRDENKVKENNLKDKRVKSQYITWFHALCIPMLWS